MKSDCYFIQPVQLLGCFLLSMMKKNVKGISLDELMRISSKFDDGIRIRYEDNLDAMRDSLEYIVSTCSLFNLFLDHGRYTIEVSDYATKDEIEYLLTCTIDTKIKNEMCKIIEQNL